MSSAMGGGEIREECVWLCQVGNWKRVVNRRNTFHDVKNNKLSKCLGPCSPHNFLKISTNTIFNIFPRFEHRVFVSLHHPFRQLALPYVPSLRLTRTACPPKHMDGPFWGLFLHILPWFIMSSVIAVAVVMRPAYRHTCDSSSSARACRTASLSGLLTPQSTFFFGHLPPSFSCTAVPAKTTTN